MSNSLLDDLKKITKYWYRKYGWIRDLIMVLIVFLIIMGVLYAYSQVWPPLVVVESSSMQHSQHTFVFGVLNAGDMVIVKKVYSVNEIETYVTGEENGFTSYGEYGNVIVYYENGETFTTPVIHRAIIYLIWNSTGGGFDAPSLKALPHRYWASSNENFLNVGSWITLYDVGWMHVTVNITLSQLAHHNGFITMGDNNYVSNVGIYDQEGLRDAYGASVQQVELGDIVGIAQGYLPWIGALKLYADGNARWVPANTWDYLGYIFLTLVAISIFIDYGIPRIMKHKKGS